MAPRNRSTHEAVRSHAVPSSAYSDHDGMDNAIDPEKEQEVPSDQACGRVKRQSEPTEYIQHKKWPEQSRQAGTTRDDLGLRWADTRTRPRS